MSWTQGGQRCHSNTVASLVSAEAKYQGVLQERVDAAAVGIACPDSHRARKLEAQYDLFHARVRHPSTPQGEADLTARLDQLAHAAARNVTVSAVSVTEGTVMAKVLYPAEAHVEGGRADGSQCGTEQPGSTHSTRPLSEVQVQALHRRVLAARDLDVDPDPTDIATVHKINSDELARFDRSWDARQR